MNNNLFKSGFIAIIGRPNVGKSTIINWLLKKKVAIVSSRPETTRTNIKGILTIDNAQLVFIDTPGIHKAHLRLGREMVKKAKSSISDADFILVVVDASYGITKEDEVLFEISMKADVPAVVLLNKTDIMKKPKLLPIIERLSKEYRFMDIIPISALNGDNMAALKDVVLKNLPSGVKYYPNGETVDKDLKFQISEVIREKALNLTRQEVPHAIAVNIEEFTEKTERNIVYLNACIYVERNSQKPIIIGHNGSMIKKIGSMARKEIETMLEKKVYLDLWVKVMKNWRNDPRAIKMLGLDQ